MNKRTYFLKKISNIFGIALVIMGFVPVPVIGQVSGVYAAVQAENERSAFLPEFTNYAGLLGEPNLSCEGEDCSPELVVEEENLPDDILEENDQAETIPDEENTGVTEDEFLSEDLSNGQLEENPVDGSSSSESDTNAENTETQSDENAQEPSSEEAVVEENNVQSEVIALASVDGVLLDENDEPIPLTSEEALETLTVADPYFTDSGTKYCFVPTGSACAVSCDVCTESATPIQDAIDAASAGTTIYMEEGAEFTESFIINKSITLTADGANKPIVKSSNGEYIVKIENTDNVSIFDLKLDGEGDSDVIGVWIVNAGDVWLEGNEIVDTAVGVQIDNPNDSTKKVRIYKNTIESKTSGSVGIKINTIGAGSLFASLNTIQNDQYNVVDNSGREDFELFFNDWGYVDGDGNYQICSMTGHTISDWTQLYTCAQLSNVLNNEVSLDGSLYPDVFDQGLEPSGGLCIAEKNDTYAIKLDQPNAGTITLGSGESLGAVGIKSSTSCYYGLAPTTLGESVTVNGEDGSACYEVTLTKREDGVLQYYFEKIGDGNGCKDISHMVGYYADPIEEQEGYCGDGILQEGEECEPGNGPCTDECEIPTLNLQLSSMCWQDENTHRFRISNPNDFPVEYTIHGAGSGGGTAPSGDSYITVSGSYGSSTTTIIKWNDHTDTQRQAEASANQDFCEQQEYKDLELNLVCLGVGQFGWSVTNPNAFEVRNVQVLVDGSLVFDGTLSANAKVGVATTSDGPSTHTMVVTWEEEGYASIESNEVCTDDYTPPPQDPPVPVTGLNLLIPVTGLDLTAAGFALRSSAVLAGLSIIGLSIGISKKRKEK